MDPLVKLGPDLSRSRSRRELGDLGGRQDRHLQPPRRRRVVERRSGHRGGLRVVVEAHDLARAGGRLRVPVLRDRRRSRVQRRARELRGAARQGRRQRARRADARGEADDTAAVVHPAGGAPLVPRRAPAHDRAPRREVDRGGEHRLQRPVPARLVGAQRQHRHRQERGLARRGQRDADPRERPDDHRRDDRRAGLRGGRARHAPAGCRPRRCPA